MLFLGQNFVRDAAYSLTPPFVLKRTARTLPTGRGSRSTVTDFPDNELDPRCQYIRCKLANDDRGNFIRLRLICGCGMQIGGSAEVISNTGITVCGKKRLDWSDHIASLGYGKLDFIGAIANAMTEL